MRQSGANGRWSSTGCGAGGDDAMSKPKKGTNMKIRAAAIGLLLAVLSPLVVSASPASADGPGGSFTTVSVDPTVVTQPGSVVFSAVVTPESRSDFPTPPVGYVGDYPGSVSFYSGSTLICTAHVALNGEESCSAGTGDLPLGTQTIVGDYSGGGVDLGTPTVPSATVSFSPSSGTTTLTVDAPVSITPPPVVTFRQRPITVTGWSAPMGASLPLVTHSSTGRRAISACSDL